MTVTTDVACFTGSGGKVHRRDPARPQRTLCNRLVIPRPGTWDELLGSEYECRNCAALHKSSQAAAAAPPPKPPIVGGKCPTCGRYVGNLARHAARQHPDVAPGCELCQAAPAAPDRGGLCIECADTAGYYADLTPAERAAEDRAMAAYADENADQS